MLLVMSTQGIFDDVTMNNSQSDSGIHLSKDINSHHLWQQTWNRIEQFLPNFLQDLFPNVSPPSLPADEAPPTATPTEKAAEESVSLQQGSTPSVAIPAASSSPLLVQRSDSPYQTPLSSPPLSNSPGELDYIIMTS